MPDLLDDIDHLIGLCPCGADPRPGSRYCSYDCEPTHIADDTDQSGPSEYGAQSTPMRWRPDLVTAHDDSGLTPIPVDRDRIGYTGPHNPAVYERADGRLHFRLDDGHRHVGCDVDATADERGVFTPAAVTAIRDAWQRLDRELGNQLHLQPGHRPVNAWDRMQHARAARHAAQERRICDWLRANRLDPNAIPQGTSIRIRDGQICVREWVRDHEGSRRIHNGEPVTAPRTAPLIEPWPDGLYYEHLERYDQVSVHAAAAITAWRAADIVAARLVDPRSILRQITSA